MKYPLKKAKNEAPRELVNGVPLTSRVFLGQDEGTLSQEIAKQVEDEMQYLVIQIVCKYKDDSYSLNSLTDSFE